MFKPNFQQPNTTPTFGFGATATATPFGQSSFGKIGTSTGFGQTAFGQSSTPMFGGQNQQNTGLFSTSTSAQPTFGQPTNTQPFAFGASNSSNLFSQPQAPTSGGLFGSTTSTTFGQKPAFGSTFGASSTPGMFGSAQATPATQPSQLFGAPGTSSTGLFGSPNSFGSTATNQATGTVIKFTPVTGTDTMVKNRITHQISTRHHCITFMKEYESKSLEELRYEDYLANRKGPQQGTSTGANLFGNISSAPNMGGGTGLFGATPAVSQGFGQTSSVFGAPQSTNLFGQKPAFGSAPSTSSPFTFNTPSTATPFGSTVAKPFGTAPPTTGLFSTPTTQSNTTFGQTNTFGFGASTSNATTGFLNQNKPATSTFNLNPTSTSGFGSFGQPQNNLFGGAKPATNVFGSTNTGFGQPATSQPGFGSFGQPQQQSGLLFNNSTFNKPATTGFGVGQTTTGGLLGSFTSQPQQQPSLFGAKTTSSIFGNPAPLTNTMSFSGFGQNGTGTTAPFGGQTSLLGQNQSTSLLFNNQNNPISNVQELVLSSVRPYPEIPCLKQVSPNLNKNRTTNPAVLQNIVEENLKLNLSETINLPRKRRSLINPEMKSLFDGLENEDFSLIENTFATKPRNPRHLYLKSSGSVITNENSSKVELDKTNKNDTSVAENTVWLDYYINDMLSTKHNSESKINQSENINGLSDAENNKSAANLANDPESPNSTSASQSDNDEEDDRETVNKENLTGIICTRPDYYTIPPIKDLEKMITSEGRIMVQGFTIGRNNYGNIYFPDTFNVYGLNIDRDVHFRNKEVVVYVDENDKPPCGVGLNRRAQVTLDQCYPSDKITLKPITDVERLKKINYEDTLRKCCLKNKTRFVEYRPETGSWVFNVEHF